MMRQAEKRVAALEHVQESRRRFDLDVLTDTELERLEAILSRHGGKFDPNAATDAEYEWLQSILERIEVGLGTASALATLTRIQGE